MIPGLKLWQALAASILLAACASDSGTDHETHWVTCGDAGTCPTGFTCAESLCVHAASPLSIPDPTGDCSAGDAGARPGYSAPAPGTTYLPDCENPLEREYWRVYAVTPHSAYVLPRPDGAYQLDLVCNTADHPLRALSDRYHLCAAAGTPEDVDVVNDMKPADALVVTHFLHSQLLFEATEGMPSVNLRPFALPGDILDACALHPETSSPLLRNDCNLEQQALDTGVELAPDFARTAAEMAQLLNELYGIGRCANSELPQRACTECGPLGGCSSVEIRCAALCTVDADCGGLPCLQGFCPVGTQCP